uniref:Uncharacterized protein n=1 Tax=Arundo donax TaxID=35708 RepID=A0A0A8ZZ12_ARUDO
MQLFSTLKPKHSCPHKTK